MSRSGAAAPASFRGVVVAGTSVILLGFGGFLAWAFAAQIDSAAIAPGVVIVDSHRKTVQHLEGGIVAALLVKDGDRVAAGQVLLRLDDTTARAQLDQLAHQLRAGLARAARLAAELAGAAQPTFLAELTAHAEEADTAELLLTERRLFDARRQVLEGELAELQTRIDRLRLERQALDDQKAAVETQRVLAQEELGTVERLLAKGYERQTRRRELATRIAKLAADRSQLAASGAGVDQELAAARLATHRCREERQVEVSELSQRTRTEIDTTREQIKSATDVRNRTLITSPQAGIVTNLQVFTVGGVVGAGMPILDIVPFDDELVVEAHLAPRDIEAVHPGQPVRVRLTAYKAHLAPLLEGDLVTVSADAMVDERSGEPFYNARVRLAPASLEGVSLARLYPGMPVEILIVTGTRRAIDYLVAPITDGMSRAMRED